VATRRGSWHSSAEWLLMWVLTLSIVHATVNTCLGRSDHSKRSWLFGVALLSTLSVCAMYYLCCEPAMTCILEIFLAINASYILGYCALSLTLVCYTISVLQRIGTSRLGVHSLVNIYRCFFYSMAPTVFQVVLSLPAINVLRLVSSPHMNTTEGVK